MIGLNKQLKKNMCVNSVLYSSSFIRTPISVKLDDINDTSGLTR